MDLRVLAFHPLTPAFWPPAQQAPAKGGDWEAWATRQPTTHWPPWLSLGGLEVTG